MGIYLAPKSFSRAMPGNAELLQVAQEQTRGVFHQNRCRKDDGEMLFSHFPNIGKHRLPGMLPARWLPPHLSSSAPRRKKDPSHQVQPLVIRGN